MSEAHTEALQQAALAGMRLAEAHVAFWAAIDKLEAATVKERT